MPIETVNGISLNVESHGSGPPVLMIMGTGATGRAWQLHQVPALVEAGYRVVTFDNRGIAPSDDRPGFDLADMVQDTIALIEHLDAGPVSLVGTSLGSRIAQELALQRPDLVSCAVFLATRGRLDRMRLLAQEADRDLRESGTTLPDSYRGVVRAVQNLSPATMAEDLEIADFVHLFERSDDQAPGIRAQSELDLSEDRLGAYREISVPCRVVAFADDLLCPPHLAAEVAEAIPDCDLVVLERCGHYGYLERPDEVNTVLVDGLDSMRARLSTPGAVGRTTEMAQ